LLSRKLIQRSILFFDSFWYTLITITTVGYGDIAPESIEGRIAGIFLLLFGVAVFGALSGKIASILFILSDEA